MEKEQNNKINFVDITIKRKENNRSYNIYRKPKATDLVIHNKSCFPTQYKMSHIDFMVNRLSMHHMTRNDRKTENSTIKYIPPQNQYKIYKCTKQNLNKNNTTTNQKDTKENTHK
jgi:hypothetical protein